MKPFGNERGMTLIEIIVSIAILGIILVAFLNMFSFGFENLVFSGQKSKQLMDLQTIVDDLNAQAFFTTPSSTAQASIINYLNSKGYHKVNDLSQISVQAAGEDINYYVSAQETKAGTLGNTVTVLKFTENGKRNARLSTFLPDRGVLVCFLAD